MPPHLLRLILTSAGAVYAGLAIGFTLRAGWAAALWPWPETPLSLTFIGAICAALAVGALWSGLSGDVGAIGGSLAALTVIYGASGAYLLAMWLEGASVGLHAIVALATALVSALLWRTLPAPAPGPVTPRIVRVASWVFAAALAGAGAALIARAPAVFPWPLSPPSSFLFGAIFLGLSLAYADAAWRGSSGAARVTLAGFLVYDLILLPPFLRHFGTVPDAHRLSLTLYTAVLLASAVLALWYFLPRRGVR